MLKDAIDEMRRLLTTDIDQESAHVEADQVLVDVLTHLGGDYAELARVYDEIEKWYA